jgi:uncharacterized protein YndB with AHSA1/START domain
MRFDLEVTIDSPPCDVFEYVTDVRNLPEWQESAVEAEWEEDGPIEVGSRARERRSFLGRTAENELEVTAYEPDRRFDLKTVSGPVRFQVAHTFEPANGGTRLRVVAEGGGGIPRLAGRMVAKQVERQFRGDLQRLREVLARRGKPL